MKKKGFTLVELIAVIVVLGILLLLGTSVFWQVRNNVLEKEFQNVKLYIESKAVEYANDTSIKLVSVGDLILAGYVMPDDETDIYDPRTDESLNCYLVSSVYENGFYEATMSDKNHINDEDGTCKDYTPLTDYKICAVNSDNECDESIDLDDWNKGTLKLGIAKRNESKILEEGSFDWHSTNGSTGKENVIKVTTTSVLKDYYTVRVTTQNNNETVYNDAAQAIKLDNQIPIIKSVGFKSDTNYFWAHKKTLTIDASDFFGSGLYKATSVKDGNCPDDITEYKKIFKNGKSNIDVTENGNLKICILDNVSNQNEEFNYEVNGIDGSGPEFSAWSEPEIDWAQEKVIKIEAKDEESGLIAYSAEFTPTSDETPPTKWYKTLNQPIYTKETFTISKVNNQEINKQGKYRVWLKDYIQNTSNLEIEVDKIDTNPPSASIKTKDNKIFDLSSITLIGTAKDEENSENYSGASGIAYYMFNESENKPESTDSNWKKLVEICGTENPCKIEEEITTPGEHTYYFWVKDQVGLVNNGSDKKNKITITIDYPTPTAPTITASDGILTGNWHSADSFDLTFESTISDNSKIDFYYGKSVTSMSKASNVDNLKAELKNVLTEAKTYYVKACNSTKTDKCSGVASYTINDETPPKIENEESDYDYITAELSDDESRIIGYAVDKSSCSSSPTSSFTTISKAYTYNMNFTHSGNGSYCIYAKNGAGKTTSKSITVTDSYDIETGTYWIIDKTGTRKFSRRNLLLDSTSVNTSFKFEETGFYDLELHGGGGGGGGAMAGGIAVPGLRGGGSGQLNSGTYSKDSVVSVTIGTGGAGGGTALTNGTAQAGRDGTTTRFGSHSIAGGGGGGGAFFSDGMGANFTQMGMGRGLGETTHGQSNCYLFESAARTQLIKGGCGNGCGDTCGYGGGSWGTTYGRGGDGGLWTLVNVTPKSGDKGYDGAVIVTLSSH